MWHVFFLSLQCHRQVEYNASWATAIVAVADLQQAVGFTRLPRSPVCFVHRDSP
jgi:hypothetical protein